MKTAALLLLLGLASLTHTDGQEAFLEVIRARSATLPVLEASAEAGSPKFTVVRFNAPPILTAGERYGAIRVVCPADKPLSLAWFFSDTMNIDEYGLLSPTGARLEVDSTRFIHPAMASADPEQERGGRHASSLPRPWDIFQLHVLGVPARLLKPGSEYLIWFRFMDQRPTDLLLAATFLDPAAKLEPADLPSIFALPALGVP
jgi:hypothetical protein